MSENAQIKTIIEVSNLFSQCKMTKDYYIYLSNLGAQRAGTSVIVIVIHLCNDEYLKKVPKEKCFCVRSIGSMSVCVFAIIPIVLSDLFYWKILKGVGSIGRCSMK